MKEIPLRELMNLADPEAHEGIGELWNQKSIHYLVVFTSADADFEIIGAGPTLPYATLEAAGQHSIPGKKAEFYVKCPGAIDRRLTPKFAPGAPRPATPSPIPLSPSAAAPATTPIAAPPSAPAITVTAEAGPTLKGRSSAPFIRPSIKLGPRAAPAAGAGKEPGADSKEPGVGSGEPGAPKMEDGKGKREEAPSAIPKPEAPAPAPQLATSNLQPATLPDLSARERALAQREQELGALFDSLKIREASLRERETAMAATEERLLKKHPIPPVRD